MRARAWVRPVGTWLVLLGVAVALDGAWGAVVCVVAAAILLARLPRQILGGIGVLCLLGVPIAVVANGIPSDEDVSPLFVVGSLWPHHLMFAGLSLVGVDAVLDVLARRRARPERVASEEELEVVHGVGDAPEPLAGVGDLARWAMLGATAIGALVVVAAVWTR